MKTLLLNIPLLFATKYLVNYNYTIYLHKLYKYNIAYKYISIYIKKILSKVGFNLKNKINSTKSNNKKSKTYSTSSHTVRKGLVWFGARQVPINNYNLSYNKVLISVIFNLRSNLSLCTLDSIKFMYYVNLLKPKYINLIFKSNKFNYNNLIIYPKSNKLLNSINTYLNIIY